MTPLQYLVAGALLFLPLRAATQTPTGLTVAAGTTTRTVTQAELAALPQDTVRAANDSCNVQLPEYASWRMVHATGFTFCVPAEWRPAGRGSKGVDARKWSKGLNWVAWDTGQPRRPRATGKAVISVTPGQPIEPPTPSCSVRRFAETIDGRAADVYNNRCDQMPSSQTLPQASSETGATWASPAVYLQGAADDVDVAERELAIYRSVRFNTGDSAH